MVVFTSFAVSVFIIISVCIMLAHSMTRNGVKGALSKHIVPTVIACVLLIAIVGYVMIGSIYLGQKAWGYLESKGYAEEEIQSIKVAHSFGRILLSYDEWIIRVVFADEPTTIYRYSFRDGEISQGGVSGSGNWKQWKHLESTW